MPEDHFIYQQNRNSRQERRDANRISRQKRQDEKSDPRRAMPDVPNVTSSVFSSATPMATSLQEIKYFDSMKEKYDSGTHKKNLPKQDPFEHVRY